MVIPHHLGAHRAPHHTNGHAMLNSGRAANCSMTPGAGHKALCPVSSFPSAGSSTNPLRPRRVRAACLLLLPGARRAWIDWGICMAKPSAGMFTKAFGGRLSAVPDSIHNRISWNRIRPQARPVVQACNSPRDAGDTHSVTQVIKDGLQELLNSQNKRRATRRRSGVQRCRMMVRPRSAAPPTLVGGQRRSRWSRPGPAVASLSRAAAAAPAPDTLRECLAP